MHPYFKDCIGAFDRTHILVQPPAGMANHSQSQRVFQPKRSCSVFFRLKFTYVLAGWRELRPTAGLGRRSANTAWQILPRRCWLWPDRLLHNAISRRALPFARMGARQSATIECKRVLFTTCATAQRYCASIWGAEEAISDLAYFYRISH